MTIKWWQGVGVGSDYLYKAEETGRHIHTAHDVSYDGILIVDKPYSRDSSWIQHSITRLDNFHPENGWGLRFVVERLRTEEEPTRSMVGDDFRRKKICASIYVYAPRKMPKKEL